MIYGINPLDNFFFRGPVPFEAGGETTVLHSVFPPLPSTYAGAFKKLVKKEQDGRHHFRIGWNGIMVDEKFCFPLPEDTYVRKQEAGGIWGIQLKKLAKKAVSNYPLEYMMYTQEEGTDKSKEQAVLYISEVTMDSYLKGNTNHMTCVDIRDKLVLETKMGIEVDSQSGTSKNQCIYTTLCIRPDESIKLAIDIREGLIREQGMVRLGGERRLATFSCIERQPDIKGTSGNSRYFKLYLATPAIFRNGWIPGWIDKENHIGYFSHRNKSVRVKLVSACVGRAIPCGGFGYIKDRKSKESKYRPQEMRFAVPAGSVYYFKLLKGTYEDAVKLFHMKCISDYREGMGFEYQIYNRSRYCDRGYGYSLIGRLNKEQEDLLNV